MSLIPTLTLTYRDIKDTGCDFTVTYTTLEEEITRLKVIIETQKATISIQRETIDKYLQFAKALRDGYDRTPD